VSPERWPETLIDLVENGSPHMREHAGRDLMMLLRGERRPFSAALHPVAERWLRAAEGDGITIASFANPGYLARIQQGL
jgi:hypothetical protein